MTEPTALSEAEFAACFAPPMQNVTANPGAIIDIWPYIDALDLDALGAVDTYRSQSTMAARVTTAR